MNKQRIAFFLPSLAGGGVEKNFLRLAQAFLDEGHAVDMVLTRMQGDYLDALPPGLNVVALRAARWPRFTLLRALNGKARVLLGPVLLPLKVSRILRFLTPLAAYLRKQRPDVLISAMPYPNIVAVLARESAGAATRVILTERNTLSQTIRQKHGKWRWRYLPALMREVYPGAEHIVAVSDGVADDLAVTVGLARESITTIYNPVVSPALFEQAQQAPEHPWFEPASPPVVLAVGRFTSAKGFDVLLSAFAGLRAQRDARLIILGDGRDRDALQAQVQTLGLTRYVDLPGFVNNPASYMAHAALFVLSSRYEGLPTVLIEALACGCAVVSTDCPSGPREILAGGEYGPLVPVDDVDALQNAMANVLDNPPDPAHQREWARMFSLEQSVKRYRALCFDS